MKLVLIPHRRRAALQVAHLAPFVGDDQRPLKLPRRHGVDPKVSRQFHRAVHPLGDVHERSVGEDSGVQRRVEVVRIGDHRPEILPHQLRVLLRRLGEGTEDDAELSELFLKRGRHGDAVKHRIDGHAGKHGALFEWNPQLLVSLKKFGIDLVEALGLILVELRSRVVDDLLEVDRWILNVRPGRLGHRLPVAVSLEAPVQQPLGFLLLTRDDPDHVFAKAGRKSVRLDIGDEPILVFLLLPLIDRTCYRCHVTHLLLYRSGSPQPRTDQRIVHLHPAETKPRSCFRTHSYWWHWGSRTRNRDP